MIYLQTLQIWQSSEQLQWPLGVQPPLLPNPGAHFLNPNGHIPALEGIINSGASLGGEPTMNGFGNNIPTNGPPAPNLIGVGLAERIITGPHSAIPHTYNGQRRNYRQKGAAPMSRAPGNRQYQPQSQRKIASGPSFSYQPQPRNPWQQNNPPRPPRRAGRPSGAGRQQRRNRRRNNGKGGKGNQNIEIEREGTTSRRRQNNSRPWRRNRTNRRNQRPYQKQGAAWNQNPTWRTPTTKASPVWQQPPTTPPSAWQPSVFDWFSDWFSPATFPPPVYAQPPSPSSVDYSKNHGMFNIAVLARDTRCTCFSLTR